MQTGGSMIFISPTSNNRAEARQLALELSRVGCRVWVDGSASTLETT